MLFWVVRSLILSAYLSSSGSVCLLSVRISTPVQNSYVLIGKKTPNNKGKIYDRGLFQYSMHINYFGDVVWSTGMALISGSLWIFLIPLYMSCGFIFLHIPRLDKHLKERYGHQYDEYAGKTKKFIPFIY